MYESRRYKVVKAGYEITFRELVQLNQSRSDLGCVLIKLRRHWHWRSYLIRFDKSGFEDLGLDL